MTPPVPDPDASHLDASVIGDLTAGLLPTAEAVAAREHLAGCASCTGTARALEDLTARLGQLPDVGPMPADVAERIEAALRDAAPDAHTPVAAAASDGARPAAPLATPLSLAEHRRTRRVWPTRLAQFAAAAAAVVFLGGVVGPALSGSDNDSEDSGETAAGAMPESAADSSAGAPVELITSGRGYTAADFASQAAALAASPQARRAEQRADVELQSGGPQPSAAAGSGAGPPSAAAGGAAPMSSSAAVPGVTAGDGPAYSTDALSRLRDDPDALAACGVRVASQVGGGSTAVAVDLATYAGAPAAVFVLSGGAGAREVVAVRPACGPEDVLARTTIGG